MDPQHSLQPSVSALPMSCSPGKHFRSSTELCLQMPPLRKGKRVLLVFFLVKEKQDTWLCWRVLTIHLWGSYLQKNEIIALSRTAKSKARKSELVYK